MEAAAGPRRMKQWRRNGAIEEGGPAEASGWGSGFVPCRGVWKRRRRGRGGGSGARGGASCATTGAPARRLWTRDRHDGVA
jgi:hypothetical protein